MRRNRIFSTITNFIVIFAMKSVVHSLVRISFFISLNCLLVFEIGRQRPSL